MKKVKLRILATLLSMILILGCSNFIVTAEDSPEITENEQQDQLPENAEEPSEIVTEDETLRDRFTKHYVAENGKRYAVVYAEQVHYEDNNGNWQEVDNSLTFDSSKQKYSTNNTESSVFEASFAPTLTQNGELVSVSDGEYTVSWSLSFSGTGNMQMTASADASIVNSTEPEAKTLSNMSDMGKAVSSVRYNSVYSDTDVRYSLSYGRVEEDIILNSRGGFTSYMMTINTAGLTAVKNADGSIDLSNTEGETVFNIDSPWMKDASGAYSSAIEVELIQRGETAYVIYAPSAEWLADTERVYPVLIDPSFTTRYYTCNYEDAYVSSDMPDECYSYQNTLWVGFDSLYQYYAYIKILNIPDLPMYSSVSNVTFNVCSPTQTDNPLDLYLVLDSWSTDPDDTDYLFYYSRPQTMLFSQLDSGTVSGSRTKFSFDLSIYDIPSEFDELYANLVEYFNSDWWHGFMLYCETGDEDSFLELCSSEYATASYRPTLTIEYYSAYSLCDRAVYSFKNIKSGKYLTVDPENSNDGANVFQKAKDNSISQAFRVIYDETNTYCEISAVHFDGTLEYNYYASTNANGYVPQNVTVYWQGADSDCQEWLIAPYDGDTKYKIVSRADPNIALTVNGTANGSGSGTAIGAAGNVIASEFTGDNSQLWEIESGGTQIGLGANIQTASENQSDFSLEIGDDIRFICPVYNYGDTVIWSVYDTDVAYNYFGTVMSVDIGQTILSARVFDIDENLVGSYTVNIYVVLKNGFYFIRNGEYYKYLRLDDDASNYATNGISCEVGRLTENLGQEWLIFHVEKEYYLISANGALNNVLSVPDGQTSALGASLTHENYTGTTRQQWKIVRTADGMYKFSPRSNESLYMSASESYTLDYDLSELDIQIFNDWKIFGTSRDEIQKGYLAQQSSNISANNRDEWILAQILPMSGSEKDYDPDLWQTPPRVQSNNNCYNYALNTQVNPDTLDFDEFESIGEYSGHYDCGDSDYVVPPKKLICYVKKDFKALNERHNLNKSFFEIGRYDACAVGAYKVALIIQLEKDYHWFRQDSSGFWSHKTGRGIVKNLDWSGNLIVDPSISNIGDYTHFIGYYSLTPWDYYYSNPNNSQ